VPWPDLALDEMKISKDNKIRVSKKERAPFPRARRQTTPELATSDEENN